jgi:ubiquinone/menaquinone biosynthesis C-methylase UbiE
MRERMFKARLIAQMKIEPEHKILDLGCGTGTLALMIKSSSRPARSSDSIRTQRFSRLPVARPSALA